MSSFQLRGDPWGGEADLENVDVETVKLTHETMPVDRTLGSF